MNGRAMFVPLFLVSVTLTTSYVLAQKTANAEWLGGAVVGKSVYNVSPERKSSRLVDTMTPAIPAGGGSCSPAWEAPHFADYAAPNDAVALEALLEASGYGPGHNSRVDAAAGNFCGGSEQELVVVQNQSPYFSILRGPAPFLRGSGDLGSIAAFPWRAVAAGNFDRDAYDEIVAVRQVSTPGVPDIFIIKVDGNGNPIVSSTRVVGGPGNSAWVDVAIGNFDNTGQIETALVKNTAAYFVLLRYFDYGSAGKIWQTVLTANLGTRVVYPWQALAAGNLDGQPGDELIAVRKVTDGGNNTVRAYRWDADTANFSLLATSSVNNTGNHSWISAAAGNFSGDGREAIALVNTKHSHFLVLDYPPTGGSELRLLAGADLDTAPGQNWRALVAADWLGDDQGHDELIAVRDLLPDPDGNGYQTDFFVYGNVYHRALRASGIEDTRSVIAGDEDELFALHDLLPDPFHTAKPPFPPPFPPPVPPPVWGFFSAADIRTWLTTMHANTYNVELRLDGEYEFLLHFLAETRDLCIDGRQFRVWITLPGPSLVQDGYRAIPVDSPLTPNINEIDYFTHGDPALDYVGWASLISRLAQDYPHIVAVGIDDFFSVHNLGTFIPDYIAAIESRLKWPSPWLNFVPTVYYGDFAHGPLRRDWALTFDSMAFYFTNEKAGISPADETVDNAPGEIADMANLLADGRKLHVGVYFSSPRFFDDPATPGKEKTSISYGYDMLTSSLANPVVSGTTAYTGSKLWDDPKHPPPSDCSGGPLSHRLCAVREAYQ